MNWPTSLGRRLPREHHRPDASLGPSRWCAMRCETGVLGAFGERHGRSKRSGRRRARGVPAHAASPSPTGTRSHGADSSSTRRRSSRKPATTRASRCAELLQEGGEGVTEAYRLSRAASASTCCASTTSPSGSRSASCSRRSASRRRLEAVLAVLLICLTVAVRRPGQEGVVRRRTASASSCRNSWSIRGTRQGTAADVRPAGAGALGQPAAPRGLERVGVRGTTPSSRWRIETRRSRSASARAGRVRRWPTAHRRPVARRCASATASTKKGKPRGRGRVSVILYGGEVVVHPGDGRRGAGFSRGDVRPDRALPRR